MTIHVETKLNIGRSVDSLIVCDPSQEDRNALTHVEQLYLCVLL